MPVPSLLTDLSTTAASNSPSGSENVFPSLDDYLRALSAFVASVSTNSATNGYTQPYLPAANPTYTGTLTGGAGVVNLGAGQFYKDASGNVGIGTASPSAKLDVVQAAGDGGLQYRSSTRTVGIGQQSGEAAVYWGSTTALTFRSGGFEYLRLDASGNQINTPSNTPPTLTANGQMNLTPTSNTNMRISYRGSDGVTRVGNITLA